MADATTTVTTISGSELRQLVKRLGFEAADVCQVLITGSRIEVTSYRRDGESHVLSSGGQPLTLVTAIGIDWGI